MTQRGQGRDVSKLIQERRHLITADEIVTRLQTAAFNHRNRREFMVLEEAIAAVERAIEEIAREKAK